MEANAVARGNVVKTLLPPGAEVSARPGGYAEGAAPGLAWNEKGACMEENGAAGGRNRC